MDSSLVIITGNDEKSLTLLKDDLEQMSLVAYATTDKNEVMELMKSLTPSALLMDVERFDPEISQLCQSLKKHETFCAIPVICLIPLQALEEKDITADSPHLPDAVLIKPVSKTLLQMTLFSMLRIADQYSKVADDYKKLKELEHLRENLINMLAHDMRHPLQAIYGYCSFLDGTIPTNITNVELSFQIKNHAFRLNQMLQNFLDMGRLESHKLPLFWEELKIGECVLQCYDRMQNLAISQDIQWELVCEEKEFTFMADSMLVGRILDNLVNNAVKYSRKGQKVILRAMPHPSRDRVIFCMEDNGPGIEDQFKEKIFEKFAAYNLHLHDKPSVGLGLAFCKMAAQAHNGDIWVEDNPRGGSIFKLVLPVKQAVAHTPFTVGHAGIEKGQP